MYRGKLRICLRARMVKNEAERKWKYCLDFKDLKMVKSAKGSEIKNGQMLGLGAAEKRKNGF